MLSIAACGSNSTSNTTSSSTAEATEESTLNEADAADIDTAEISTSDKTISEASQPIIDYEITYQNFKLYVNSLGNLTDYVIVQVKNTGNVDLYLKDATFSFLNEDGSLAGVDSGLISSDPDIIAPGEYGYFYSNQGSVGGDMDADGNYSLMPELSIKESQKEPINYEISNTSISEGKYGPVSVIGQITNTTDEDDSMVWVAFVFFDENDNPIGACGTNVMDVTAGSTKSFDGDSIYLSGLDFTIDDVSRYEVYASKTQYQF